MSGADAVPRERSVDVGVELFLQEWPGEGRPFLLLHGLASNCRTWEAVAARLHAAGHPVAAADLRGHGRSGKPDSGYDFKTITGDVVRLLDALGWEEPMVAGQSWGGNVVLEFAARFPGRAYGVGFVDGGFLHLQGRPEMTWDHTVRLLRPPSLAGLPRERLERRIRRAFPEWDEWGIHATLANFETLADGTVRRRLPLERHMEIVRAMWEQDTPGLLARVEDPALLCVTRDGARDPEVREREVAAAQAAQPDLKVVWFPRADHDIHVHQPEKLARTFREELAGGVWTRGGSG